MHRRSHFALRLCPSPCSHLQLITPRLLLGSLLLQGGAQEGLPMARIGPRLMSRLLESSSSKLGLAPGAPSLCSSIPALRSLSSAGQPQQHQSSEGSEETTPPSRPEETTPPPSVATGTQEADGEANRADAGQDAEDYEGGVYVNKKTGEIGGPRGPEPTRYGDWERGGRCSDF